MEAEPQRGDSPDRGVNPQHPWLGLSAFSLETQEYFFGRDEEVREIFLRVRDNPLTVLYGQSGLGKTSLLGAGLMPKLMVEGYRPILIRLEYEADSPPLLSQIRNALVDGYGEPIPGWSADETVSDVSLWEMFHRRGWGPPDMAVCPPVIILDQLEEVFTLADGDDPAVSADIERFFGRMADLVENRPPDSLVEAFRQNRRLAGEFDYGESPLRIVFTLREDFLSALEAWKPAMPSLMQNRMALLRLDGLQALEAVVRPGRMGDAELVSDEVGARIVRFVAKKPDDTPLEEIRAVPPLLSLLCHELNSARLAASPPGERITAELVESQGSDILQNFYRRSFSGLDPAVRHFVEDRMLTKSGHRTPVAREDAESELKDAGVDAAGQAIDGLIAGRLLSAEDKGGLQRLEITHDVIAPLALASRTERRDREEVEKAKRQEEKARRASRRWLILFLAITSLAIASIAGAIYGTIGMRRAEEANLKQIEMLRAASRSDHARAEQLFQEGKGAEGLAYLARALQFDSGNLVAAGDALSALQYSRVPYWRLRFGQAHDSAVTDAVFSPDGKLIASGSEDGLVRVWDAETGEAVFEPLSHPAGITRVRFGPDQKRLAVATSDNSVRIWDLESVEAIGEPIRHTDEIFSMTFSPDGGFVATASADNSAGIWDTETGQLQGESLEHVDEVRSVNFSPDGTLVITASRDYSAQVWSVPSGAPVGDPIRHNGEVRSAAFSPDGKWIVTASYDHNVRLFDLESRLLLSTPFDHGVEVEFAAFSPDGGRVVSLSADDAARIWNVETGEIQGSPAIHGGRIESVAFSPDGRRYLTASADNSAQVWDVATGAPVGSALEHADSVFAARFNRDGSRVVTAAADKAVRVWNRHAGQPRGLAFWHEDEVFDAKFDPEGNRIVTASDDNTAQVWDLRTGLALGQPLTHDYDVNSVAFDPDGSRVVTGSNDGTARLWDAETGQPVGEPLQHEDYVKHVAFSPKGNRIVTSSWDRTARLWDGESGKALGEPLRHEDKVDFASFSPDGNRVVTASADFTARVWEVESTSPAGALLQHEAEVGQAVFSPDGTLVATASADQTARIWNAGTGEPMGDPLRHAREVTKVAFHPEGNLLVTACADGSVQIWEVETGKRFGEPFLNDQPANDVSFSPDGRFLLAAAGRSARIWHVESGMPLARPLGHVDTVSVSVFSRDGLRALTTSADRSARVWDLKLPGEPAPDWFFESAIPGYAGKKIERDGAARIIPLGAPERDAVDFSGGGSNSDADPYRITVEWLAADSRVRPVSPGHDQGVPELIERTLRRVPGIRAAVVESYDLDPMHPLVHIALARFEDPPFGSFFRTRGMERLLDPSCEAVYGIETWARYCRIAERMLSEQGDFENSRKASEKAETLESSGR